MAEITPDTTSTPRPGKSAAGTVAVGILSSRIVGLVRTQIVAFFFGVSAYTDVFEVALRGPNLLQNLLGEGTLSAAFIPVYSRLLDEGREQEAGRFAGAVFGLLLAVATAVVLVGIALAEPMVTLFAPGFLDDAAKVASGALPINRFAVSVNTVRIVFPMAGVLVLSAWALGVLNSHRRFFLPYFAPVLWNVAIIGALFAAAYLFFDAPFGAIEEAEPSTLLKLLYAAFYGALIGGILQFAVQLPLVIRVIKGFRLSFSTKVVGVQESMRAFGPVVAGRGVSQLASYLDMFLGSLLAAGALAALRNALTLYLLPVSLFGLSVAASELPELSRFRGTDLKLFLSRFNRAVSQMLFLTIPTVIGYLGLGYLVVGALFQRGAFGLPDTWLVYIVLVGYSLGLLATTVSRLLQNAFYALQETKTPARIAVVRVIISTASALPLMFWLDRYSVAGTLDVGGEGSTLFFGAVGLALGASIGAWIEFWQLTRALRKRIETFHLPWPRFFRMLGLATLSLALAGLLWSLLPPMALWMTAVLVIGLYAASYLALARLFQFPEVHAWTGRFLRRK